MVRVTKYTSKEMRDYFNLTETEICLCVDNKNALHELGYRHLGIREVVKRLCRYVGPFLVLDDNEVLLDRIVSEALNNFEDKYQSMGLDYAYKCFVETVLLWLPEVTQYRVYIDFNNDEAKFWDFFEKDMLSMFIKTQRGTLIVEKMKFETTMPKPYLGMLLAHKVLSRNDLVFINLPSVGFSRVVDFDCHLEGV